MWSYDKHRLDLRVALTVLLRVHLAKNRFFSESKKYRSNVHSVKKRKKAYVAPVKKLMVELFKIIAKFEKGQLQKSSSIEKYVNLIFKKSSTSTESSTNKSNSEGTSLVAYLFFTVKTYYSL